MIVLTRTDSDNPDFRQLVTLLDHELSVRDGDDHAFYDQFNKIVNIKNAIVAYEDHVPVGCGAIKEFEADTMEVKRMYVPVEKRGQGIATLILKEAETWATELECKKLVLETGHNQPEAIQLYKKNGYHVIPNYGQYQNIANSICFEKTLIVHSA